MLSSDNPIDKDNRIYSNETKQAGREDRDSVELQAVLYIYFSRDLKLTIERGLTLNLSLPPLFDPENIRYPVKKRKEE